MGNNSESRLIAARYTKALFDLAVEQNALESVEKDLKAFGASLASSEELGRFIHNPTLPRQAKAAAVGELLGKAKASPLVAKFFALLAANNRLAVVNEIIEQFMESVANFRGEEMVEITSAQPMNDAQTKAIIASLKKATGKEVRVKQKENPALLGGLTIKVGGKLLDHSIAGKLERLGAALKTKTIN